MFNALAKYGAAEYVKFTRYPDLMHDSWTAAYGNFEVFEWMLRPKRKWKGDERVVPEENKAFVA